MYVIQPERGERDSAVDEHLALKCAVLVRRERHRYLMFVDWEVLQMLRREDYQPNDVLETRARSISSRYNKLRSNHLIVHSDDASGMGKIRAHWQWR